MGLFNKNASDSGSGKAGRVSVNHQGSRQDTDPLSGATEYPNGVIAKNFFGAVDQVVKFQGPAISSYVARVKKKHSAKSVAQQQAIIDQHFLRAATATGAGTGGVAAFPGIGTALSVAGIAAEAVLLLQACAAYAVASAELHGVDTRSEEQRRAIVLLAVTGASDKDLVAALAQDSALSSIKNLRGLTTATGSQLVRVNSILGRMALRQVRKRFKGAMVRKGLPLGVGVVLGAGANRTIAKDMIEHVHHYLRTMNV